MSAQATPAWRRDVLAALTAPVKAWARQPIDGRSMARTLGLIYAIGPAVSLIWLPFSPAGTHRSAILVMIVISWCVAALLLSGRLDRQPRLTYQAPIFLATALASIGLYLSREPTSELT